MATREKLIKLILKGDPMAFHAFCRDLTEEELDISGATFRAINLTGYDLSGFDLSASEWEDCTMTGVRLEGADLSNSYLHGCALVNLIAERSNFEGAAIENCVVRGSQLIQCDLTTSELSDSKFIQCELGEGNWAELEWSQLTFEDSTLRDVSEASGTFKAVQFRASRLTDFDGSGLTASRCFTQKAEMTRSTLPDGFTEKSGRRRTV